MTRTEPARGDDTNPVGEDRYPTVNGDPVVLGDTAGRGWRRPRIQPKTVLTLLAAATATTGSVVVSALGDPSSPEEAVSQYTSALHEEDYDAAYEVMCRNWREAYGSVAAFAKVAAGVARETPHPFVVIDGEAHREEASDVWDVTVRSGTGHHQRMRYIVVEEDGDFRVCSLP